MTEVFFFMLPFFSFSLAGHSFLLPLYGLCIVTGIFVSAGFAYSFIKHKNLDYYKFIIISTFIFVFGMSGARLLFVIVSVPAADFFTALIDPLSGYVFYGGLIFGPLGYFVGLKIAGCKSADWIGMYSWIIPLVHGFGRIGCFCAGCCYGIEYDGFCAVHYLDPLSSVSVGTGIFPVQLLETIFLFMLAFIIAKREWIRNDEGYKNFVLYLMLYSVLRFCLEFLRGDSERGHLFMLSVSQCISILVFTMAVIFLFCEKKDQQT